jgi:hypothetical protein
MRIKRIEDLIRNITDKPIAILLIFFLSMGVAAVAVISNPLQRGLMGYYYDNIEWTGSPILTVRERVIDLYGMKVEFPSLKTHYSIQWKGVIFIPSSGEYQFTTVSDDGSELHINQQLIVDNRGAHGFQEQTGTVYLDKGFYPINIRYRQKDGSAELNVDWKRPGHERETLSQAPLFLKKPTKIEFFAGRLFETVFTVCKLLGLVTCMGSLLMIFYKRYTIVVSANHCIALTLIFLVVFIGHFWGSINSTSYDSMWTIPTTLSMIREKNVDLDEYQRVIEKERYYAIEMIGHHLYSVYPIGTSMLAIPFIYVLDRFLDRGLSIDLGKVLKNNYEIRGGIEIWIASVFMAVSSMFIYLIADVSLKNLKYSILTVFIFAFCTSVWSTASRALWQHTSSILLLTVSLYLIILAKEKPNYEPLMVRLVGIVLAFSYVVRPTNSLSILLLTIYVFLRHRKHFLSYCLWSMVVLIPFVLFNLHLYHSLLSTYYLPQHQFRAGWHFGEALAGHLFSPSRGLLVFSPVFLFSIYGIVLKVRNKQMGTLDYALLMIMFLHWVIISTFPAWWAGHSYGPRYFSDMIPYFIYFLIPAIMNIFTLKGIRKVSAVFLLFCAIIISFFIHFRGATDWDVYAWNSDPINVDVEPSRVWDWRDIQFLRGMK